MNIHPTAFVAESCELADDVVVGAYAILEGNLKVDSGCEIGHHATLGCKTGKVSIGKNNKFYPYSFVGGPPQDSSYAGEMMALEIGDNNLFREFVTVNIGTSKDRGLTTIGNDCMLMAYVHVAHDCIIGDRVIIANTSNFAGHVVVHDDVKIGGACNFSQFTRLGEHSYIAGDSTINKDILPFSMAQGKYATSRATNKIGLERAGWSKAERDNIHKAIRLLTKGERTLEEAITIIENDCDQDEHIKYLVDFLKTSEKGIAR